MKNIRFEIAQKGSGVEKRYIVVFTGDEDKIIVCETPKQLWETILVLSDEVIYD